MRQLRLLLSLAARQLQQAPSPGVYGSTAAHLGAGAKTAAAFSGRSWEAHGSHPPPFGLAAFATGAPPPDGDSQPEAPHRGERAQSATDAAADREQLGEEIASADALSAVPAGVAAPDTDAADETVAAAAAAVAEAEDSGAGLDGASADDEDAVASALAMLGQEGGSSSSSDSESDLPQDLELGSDLDEDEVAEILAQRRRNKPGTGVLAQKERQSSVLEEIQGASKKRQRFLLQQRLTGSAGADAAEQEGEGMRPPELGNFAMKVVDVNRTSKGGRAGRIQGYSALVVVGNSDGVLGQGGGKSAEAKAAVDKATRKALKHLTYVPRFRGHTVHYPTTVHFGKTKLIIYPRASARGITANPLMSSICQLAGIKDIGIKIQGSRNLRNSVQALFKAFDEMQARVDEDSVDAMPSPQWISLEARYQANLESLQQEIEQVTATA